MIVLLKWITEVKDVVEYVYHLGPIILTAEKDGNSWSPFYGKELNLLVLGLMLPNT